MKIDLFIILIFYFFLGFIFKVLLLKFTEKEISKWTTEEISKQCSSIDFKWFLLNSVFIFCFGYLHSINLMLFGGELIFLEELFRGLILCFWISSLIVLARVDLKTYLLPDRLTLALGIIGIIFSIFYENISLKNSLISAFLSLFFLVLLIFFLFHTKNLLPRRFLVQ